MSRICVKNLLKYVAEDRLREYFSQKGEVTDAKLMRTKDGKSRQFGFVGFRTEQEADEAIKYFNKSFMDTCRITCEIARKVGDPDIPRPWSRHSLKKKENSSEEEKSLTTSKVSKAVAQEGNNKISKKDDENDDPQLEEFLQVMQHRSRSKMWANDTVAAVSKEKGHKEKLDEDFKEINGEVNVQLEKAEADKSKIVVHDEVVSDLDYFKSRVKEKWSDSESSEDEDSDDTDHSDSDNNNDSSNPQNNSNHDSVKNKLEPDDFEGEAEDDFSKECKINGSADPSSSPKNKNDEVLESGRLFIRNFPYTATEEELEEHFSKYGTISQVHIVIDKETRRSKGFAYVLFALPESAARALEEMDSSIFQGRLLHVMPAKQKNPSHLQESNNAGNPSSKTFKQQRDSEKKASEAAGNTRAWNSLYMRPDTVVENIARKFGVSKGELLDRESDGVAARIALGETQVIAETKKALSSAGVNVTSLEEFSAGNTDGQKRSNHVILVKNLPYGSSESELSDMFGKFGSVDKIILPPTKTLALVIFLEPSEARAAFRGLSYKRYKDGPLYLEWAPGNILCQTSAVGVDKVVGELDVKRAVLKQRVEELTETDVDPDRIESRSVYVKNLNFKTSDESVKKHFVEHIKGGKILSVRVKKHIKNGKNVSMGFGFIMFSNIRNIVDKTSQFVAKNGPEFEKRIIASNEGNPKFNFLRGSDPYHAYYQHRLSVARAQNQSSALQPLQPGKAIPDAAAGAPAADTGDASAKPDPAAQFRPVRKVLEPPEAEQYTVRLPEGITGEELDIIKLTAQFVARNGKSFLTGLTSRESTNPQFHFLRPTHSMFMFFTSLADAYSKVLMPPKGLNDKLRKSVADMTTVLERCLHRLEWERSQEQARQKAEDEIEQERLQMAMIDWHDFVVVETIDFADDEDEDLPPPMTLDEVIRRSKMSAMDDEDIVEPGKELEIEMDEEEVQMVEEGMRAASLEENGDSKNNEVKASLEENEPPMRIVKNWKRPEDRIPAERDPTKYVVSPITGELIPISEMSEHMRISLIDPKFKEQKDRMFAKIRETTLATDDDISRNIVGLARTRPDIFGTTEEVSNAVKAEIEKKKDEQPKQVIWDGHTGSIGRTTSQAMSQNTGEDISDALNNDGRNLPGPAPPPPRPGMPSIRPLPPPPGLALNILRPPTMMQYSTPTSAGGVAPPPPGPPNVNMIPSIRPPPPSMQMMHAQHLMANRLPMPNIPVPPPPGSQFTPLTGPRSFVPVPMSQPGMHMAPPPMHQGMPPPPPPEEAPPPLPEEPEPKRQRLDDSMLIPEEQFLAQHSGPARISISVPSLDEGNLKGQVLEISVQSFGSLKEKIAGEVQLPANKQKLSGKAGFLKDNLSLAYYNVASGEALSLSLRERGGRKR